MQGFCSRKRLLSTTDCSSGKVCVVANRKMYSLNGKCGDFIYSLLGAGGSIILQYLRRCSDDAHYYFF